MSTAWNFADESVTLETGGATITLVQGSTFCICERTGDIRPGGPQGLFVRDTRFCSKLVVTFDGEEAEPLAVNADEPFGASFVSRTRPGHGGKPPILVFRRHWVGRGMRSDITIRNDSPAPRRVVVEVQLGADHADLFAVKEGRAAGRRLVPAMPGDHHGHLMLGDSDSDRRTAVRFDPEPVVSPAGTAWWTAEIAPREDWTACIEFAPVLEHAQLTPRYRCGQPLDLAEPHARLIVWRGQVPTITSDIPALDETVARSADDLGALRIFDPDHPGKPVIAAGAPWYMTLFGRDSILTSWMSLILDTSLALAVAETLARLQGQKVDESTEEQPGRILHELRFGSSPSMALAAGHVYYGTIDATPLFVMLVGELLRWGIPMDQLERLLPAVDSALEWVTAYGDRDGDGYVEYERMTSGGLANQGWKDSADGVSFADGRLPEPPIALCEVQAYVYAAWMAGAALADAHGDHRSAAARRQRAEALRVAFNRDFWMADRQTFAIGLDGHKRQIDSVTSNPGHCLWAGIVDSDKAPGVAASLLDPSMFGGWGVRTLSTSMARYNPLSYHNGSVWPHDSAICAAGLRRYGFTAEAGRIATALLAASEATDHRLPELFSGLSVDDFPLPVAYPTSCSPQAWASAAPLLLVRAMLGLEPDLASGAFAIDPVLPEGTRRLRIDRLPLAGHRVDIAVEGDDVRVTGLPRGVELRRPGSGT